MTCYNKETKDKPKLKFTYILVSFINLLYKQLYMFCSCIIKPPTSIISSVSPDSSGCDRVKLDRSTLKQSARETCTPLINC